MLIVIKLLNNDDCWVHHKNTNDKHPQPITFNSILFRIRNKATLLRREIMGWKKAKYIITDQITSSIDE